MPPSRFLQNGYKARKYKENEEFKGMIKVLFVCHGNICRSPMAEFIMKDLIAKKNLEHFFYIASAATSTEEIWNGVGNTVYPMAQEELKKHAIFCGNKRAVQVTKQDYEAYDYLICMDTHNLRNLERIIGKDVDHKVSLLLDYAGRKGESIADPWYTQRFNITYADILQGCLGLLQFLGF